MIGKGAFGTVYLVKKGANKYALKAIPLSSLKLEENDGLEINPDNLKDCFKEVKIYQNLQHPNIVKYYESFLEK